jgi:hypothetical protein
MPLPLRFAPVADLIDVPHVVVDGSAAASTLLTLSHWPGSPTPASLRADLSAEIAFLALGEPERFDRVGHVTNNHFDQDGVAGIYALVDPAGALPRREQVIDVARAGDFARWHERDSMRIAMAIAAFEDPDRSPLDPAVFRASDGSDAPYDLLCGRLYAEVLARFPVMLDDPAALRPWWADEDAHLDESLAAIASGEIAVTDHPEVDLAVVRVPSGWAERASTRFTVARRDAVHPAAIAMSTERLRVLVLQEGHPHLDLRYESWVMLTSRPVAPRPDLRTFVERLDALEQGATRWAASGPGAILPRLAPVPGAESTIEPDVLVRELLDALAGAPAAWDPFAAAG